MVQILDFEREIFALKLRSKIWFHCLTCMTVLAISLMRSQNLKKSSAE